MKITKGCEHLRVGRLPVDWGFTGGHREAPRVDGARDTLVYVDVDDAGDRTEERVHLHGLRIRTRADKAVFAGLTGLGDPARWRPKARHRRARWVTAGRPQPTGHDHTTEVPSRYAQSTRQAQRPYQLPRAGSATSTGDGKDRNTR